MSISLVRYLQEHLDFLLSQAHSDGALHQCEYVGCTALTRARYCEEHHALQRLYIEKYHIWNNFKDDSRMKKQDVAKTELILRDRYEYLFNIIPDAKHVAWKDTLVAYVTVEDIEEIIRYARAQNQGYNVPYWEEKLRQKRGG